MKKKEQFLAFDKLKIVQDDAYFKYNLDSILLADFVVKHYKKGNIIDLATGNIPIPLFINYRLKKQVYAVELQQEVYNLGLETISINNLGDQIVLINENIKNLKKHFKQNLFDVVVCNPPYFKLDSSKKISKINSMAKARHELELNLNDIIDISKYLLNNNGSLFLIFRTERIVELLKILSDNNLEPKVIRMVYPKDNEKSKLFLIEARLNAKDGCIIEKPLVVYNDDEYTKEIIDMFGE